MAAGSSTVDFGTVVLAVAGNGASGEKHKNAQAPPSLAYDDPFSSLKAFRMKCDYKSNYPHDHLMYGGGETHTHIPKNPSTKAFKTVFHAHISMRFKEALSIMCGNV